MARPKQFDEQEAVKKALTVFRTKGYKATSLADLTKAMGLSRSSLYETFGSKHELFLTTLELFDKSAAIYNFVDSDSNKTAKILLAQMFARVIVSAIEGQGGCMFGNCAVEFSNTDQQVLMQVTKGIEQLESMFISIIEAGQANGDVPQDKNIRAIASSLIATFYGIQTMAKAGLGVDSLKQAIGQTLTQLD